MSYRRNVFAASIAASMALPELSSAGTVRSVPNQCSYELPDWYEVGVATWTGQCGGGKAEGKGMASGGGTLRLSGEFHEGKVVSADGVFQRMNKSNHTLEFLRVTGKDGQWSTAPLFDRPGQVLMPGWILGEWQVKYSDGRCEDTQKFEAARASVEVRSGTSRLNYFVHFYKVESQPGWLHMLRVSTSMDFGQNCMKQRGEQQVLESAYLRRQDRDRWQYCTEPAESACVGIAKAVKVKAEPKTENSPPDPFEEHKKTALDALYAQALAAHPGLEGRIAFQITTESSGAVAECEVTASDFADVPGFEQKMCDSIKTISYPPFPGRIGTFKTAEFRPPAN